MHRIHDNLIFFKRNTQYVSLPIWQYVFDLQEDWDITIKEASAVLIQLCAPKESINHFFKVKKEGENLRLKILLNNFSAGSPDVGSKHRMHQIMSYISNNSGEGSSVKSDRNLAMDASEYANQSRTSTHEEGSNTKNYPSKEEEKKMKGDQLKFLEGKAKEINSSSSIYDEEVRAYNRTDPRQEDDFMREEYVFEFYVDNYSDDKIKEIISIFRNDFKPPKNLWIENMNIQGNSEANYFNDVFADDDNYNDSEENSPKASDVASHNEEVDDIGYNISDVEKSKPKVNKPKKEEVKSKEQKKNTPKQEETKEEAKYVDRIKPKEDRSLDPDDISPPQRQSESAKEDLKPTKQKPKKNKADPPASYKVQKAKDGLNIEIDTDPMGKADKKSKDSSKQGKSKTPKNPNIPSDDFNKTRKLPSNLFDDLNDDEVLHNNENREENNISIGQIAKECEDEIDEKLLLIGEEKARLELERLNKKHKEDRKGNKSKNRSSQGNKSNREGYKKKRPHSHKKRGSASNMQELKKKMGFINSQTSRGRGGETFLNYSLDEINQKLQAHANNYNISGQKSMKKRLNKSFENVFSACASTSRTKRNMKRHKNSKKKPISSSPRRMSMRDKKGSQSHAKTPNSTSRKKLNNSLYSNRNNTGYNAKELADKLCLINFSSMPSTPTGNTFIKKLGEKMNIMKSEKEKMIYNF